MWILFVTWKQKLINICLVTMLFICFCNYYQDISTDLLDAWCYTEQSQSHLEKKMVSYSISSQPLFKIFMKISYFFLLSFWLLSTLILLIILRQNPEPLWLWLLFIFSNYQLFSILSTHHKKDETIYEQNGSIYTYARMVTNDELEMTQKKSPDLVINSQEAGQRVAEKLVQLVLVLPIGTNLALLHFLWMLVSGQLLNSRGAIFPALQALALSDAATRRAWAAFGASSWQTSTLLKTWQEIVITENEWQEHCHEGYHPKAVDLTAFWRPTLEACPTKHYHHQAGKALPAIVLGVVTRVG